MKPASVVLLCGLCILSSATGDQQLEELRRLVSELNDLLNPQTRAGLGGSGLSAIKDKVLPAGNKLCTVMGALGSGSQTGGYDASSGSQSGGYGSGGGYSGGRSGNRGQGAGGRGSGYGGQRG